MIAALYVEKGGVYFGLPDVDPWDESRDARLYAGPHPVVAHPPCQLWTNLAFVNFKRYGGERNRPGIRESHQDKKERRRTEFLLDLWENHPHWCVPGLRSWCSGRSG